MRRRDLCWIRLPFRRCGIFLSRSSSRRTHSSITVRMLIERRIGVARLFVNAENLLNVRQTRYDPLVRPQQHFDGSWTVDAWTLLEGRVVNAGLRFSF